MLISLAWIRDYVDLPADLDVRALAERFTRTTAEVDRVQRIEVRAQGLTCARVAKVSEIPGSGNKRLVTLDVGGGKTIETVSIAGGLAPGRQVAYAPLGASVAAFGKLAQTTVAGKTSSGMILPGESLGIDKAIQEAIFLSGEFAPGDALPDDLFDDWVIEIDNKSITNRPDLWGHYGIAREIAAILDRPLKPYPVSSAQELQPKDARSVSLQIADARACPRYSALTLEGVPTQPAPLWMQLRLGHVGQRPISGLVDLTNYIMMDLGQPMHAFDASKVDCIEVDWAADGERFRTLDGIERVLSKSDLMIKRRGESIALAGLMGGLETEVGEATRALLLESANFNPATVRRTAKRLALRTEASARFEKSLDPEYTVLAIQRFVHLAKAMYPNLKLTSALSDAYPAPRQPLVVDVDPAHVSRTIGRPIERESAATLLGPLGFEVSERAGRWQVAVPSFRATGDVSIEADVIEEIARRVGYDTIEPAMPRVTVRPFAMNRLHELEQRTIEYFTTAQGFNETHGYLWYDSRWLDQIGYDPGPCIELVNAASEGQHRLRQRLMPGLLAAVSLNRFHFSRLAMIELGSVFAISEKPGGQDHEFRHAALVLAERSKGAEHELDLALRSAITGWAWERFGRDAAFEEVEADPRRPWEQARRTADVVVGGVKAGRTSFIGLPLRRAMDEHLVPWSIVWAELWLSHLQDLGHSTEQLGRIPEFPVVEIDFSILVPRAARYHDVVGHLHLFRQASLRQIRFITAYEGKSIDSDRRSLTFRAVVGDQTRTLTDDDINEFRRAFESHIQTAGYEIRG